LATGLAASSPSFADIYKFIDEDGVVHYTNVPTHGKFKLILKEKRVEFHLGPNFERYDATIMKAAGKHGVDYALVKAVIKAESNFNPTAISRVGARGLMQLMPGTAYSLRVNDSFHPEDNIDGGVRYLRYLLDLYQGNVYLALAAYNAGEKAVYRYRGVPPYPETQAYVKRVLRYHEQYINEPKKIDQSADNTN
jgi:soluble lytic murein transglycosylase-like protein